MNIRKGREEKRAAKQARRDKIWAQFKDWKIENYQKKIDEEVEVQEELDEEDSKIKEEADVKEEFNVKEEVEVQEELDEEDSKIKEMADVKEEFNVKEEVDVQEELDEEEEYIEDSEVKEELDVKEEYIEESEIKEEVDVKEKYIDDIKIKEEVDVQEELDVKEEYIEDIEIKEEVNVKDENIKIKEEVDFKEEFEIKEEGFAIEEVYKNKVNIVLTDSNKSQFTSEHNKRVKNETNDLENNEPLKVSKCTICETKHGLAGYCHFSQSNVNLPGILQKPMSDFLMFMEEEGKERAKKENPSATNKQIRKIVGQMWAVMGDRTKYHAKAKAAKEKYDEEYKEWFETRGLDLEAIKKAKEGVERAVLLNQQRLYDEQRFYLMNKY